MLNPHEGLVLPAVLALGDAPWCTEWLGNWEGNLMSLIVDSFLGLAVLCGILLSLAGSLIRYTAFLSYSCWRLFSNIPVGNLQCATGSHSHVCLDIPETVLWTS